MSRILLALACVYSAVSGYNLGSHLCPHPQNPVVDSEHGFTLDEIIDLIIIDTDLNKNGIIDIDEARVELLARWSNGSDSVSRATFVELFHNLYYEDKVIAGQFFDNLDANHDGFLTETDFLLQILDMGIIPIFDNEVDLEDFRRFLHKRHPNGCL